MCLSKLSWCGKTVLLAHPTEIGLGDFSLEAYVEITWLLLMEEYFVDVQSFYFGGCQLQGNFTKSEVGVLKDQIPAFCRISYVGDLVLATLCDKL